MLSVGERPNGHDASEDPLSGPWRELARRVRADVRRAADSLTVAEVRYLVSQYYAIQDFRIQAGGQVNALERRDAPHLGVSFIQDGMHWLEDSIKAVLDRYTATEKTGMGAWAREIVGIGPVLSAGVLSNVNLDEAPTVGHIWRFAGLDPTNEWYGRERAEQIVKQHLGDAKKVDREMVIRIATAIGRRSESLIEWSENERGNITREALVKAISRRPWNARFKVVCWKIGESFVKVSGKPNAVYGHLYLRRKAQEIERNRAGLFAAQAEEKLRRARIGSDTDAYKYYSGQLMPVDEGEVVDGERPVRAAPDGQGVRMLPPAHIHARAKRYATKQFLADWWSEAYRRHFKKEPPLPYPIAILGHGHYRPGLGRAD